MLVANWSLDYLGLMYLSSFGPAAICISSRPSFQIISPIQDRLACWEYGWKQYATRQSSLPWHSHSLLCRKICAENTTSQVLWMIRINALVKSQRVIPSPRFRPWHTARNED